MAERGDIPWHEPPPSVKEWWKRPLLDEIPGRVDREQCKQEGSSASWVAGQGCDWPQYNGCDLVLILGSYQIKHEVNTGDLLREIVARVSVYLRSDSDLPLPSDIKRKIKSVLAKMRKAHDALHAPDHTKSDLRRAGRDLAGIDGSLPDFPAKVAIDFWDAKTGEPIPLEVWPVEDQIALIESRLAWLCRVAERAAQNAKDGMKKAAKRPDAALHSFVREIDSLYRATAVEPANPHVAASGEGEGELLHLLHACLYPLHTVDVERFNRTWTGLESLWRRAMGKKAQRRRF